MVQFTGLGGNLASLYRIADKQNVWLLELQNGAENRLTIELMQKAIHPALDIVEQEHFKLRNTPPESTAEGAGYQGGALIITGLRSQSKFFCNGFNLEELVNVPGMLPEIFVPLAIRLLSFPIPTIAAMNGHAFAGGYLLAMSCDYRVMTSGKAWASMNEIKFGAPFPHGIGALFGEKIRDPRILRETGLGHRFTPQELLQAGIVDVLADRGAEGVLSAAYTLADKVSGNASKGAYGLIKKEIYGGAIAHMKLDIRSPIPKL
ncbi:hypothetical protein FRB93_013830 [Tulasnella sp. JGI-2019a]|nr:hypothetical protein FRB93_013830 [Tulasnella sp. JGI-2019a]